MEISIELGWWLLPTMLSVALWLHFCIAYEDKDGFDAMVASFIYLIATLIIWLVYFIFN